MRLIVLPLAVVTLLVGCNGQKTKEKSKESISESYSDSLAYTDEALLDSVQYQTFNYFWDGAEPVSGLARERIHMDGVYPNHDKDIITRRFRFWTDGHFGRCRKRIHNP